MAEPRKSPENRISKTGDGIAFDSGGFFQSVVEEQVVLRNTRAPQVATEEQEMANSEILINESATAKNFESEPPGSGEMREPSMTQSRKPGWISPEYHTSQKVEVDPQRVEKNRCIAFRSDAPEVDAYRILRTRILQHTAASGGNTIMITSAVPGEGKTLTAINLALTFAREFKQTALLVDCDLKNQRIQNYFGIRAEKGLVDYLIDDCPIADLMIWPGVEKLTLISGGRTIDESAELLGSPRMKELVAEMKDRYPERYIFFDVPAILSGADALAFAALTDHILVTVRAGHASRDQINQAVAMLPADKVLGLVLNGEKENQSLK